MRTIFIIGIGVGNPDHLTVQAVNALNRVDVVFIPNKGAEKEDLRRLRHEICERFITHREVRFVEFAVPPRRPDPAGYLQEVEAWHRQSAEQYAGLIGQRLREDEVGAFLVWGDPSLYDSTLRIIDAVRARGDIAFEHEVIPGITSVQALAARHRLVLNAIGEAVQITTGRRLAEGFPDDAGSAVVMLDGEQAFARLDRPDLEIFWGAYLGTADEVLVSGPLSEVAGDIERIRAEARRAKGWVMDTYLLRKRRDG